MKILIKWFLIVAVGTKIAPLPMHALTIAALRFAVGDTSHNTLVAITTSGGGISRLALNNRVYVGGSYTSATTADAANNQIALYVGDQFDGYGKYNQGTFSANNVVILQWSVPDQAMTFSTLSNGSNGGSGSGVNGEVKDVYLDSSETYVALGGSFSQAGGYSNNGRFAVYKPSGNGWGDYFYYPSSVNGYSGVYVNSLSGNGSTSVAVSGSGISSFTDQYTSYSGSIGTLSFGSRYWTSVR